LKVSIITATFNSSSTIADCISSVNEQTYHNIEHIIIDGASSDNTLQIIKSNPGRVTKIVSEPDKGIYDAMNKGIVESTGEVVAILNSDDIYYDSYVIEKVIESFMMSESDSVYGDLVYVERSNVAKNIRYWKTSEYKPDSFFSGWHPAHPAFFLKRTIYERYGSFDLTFSLAADFELMLRVIEKHHISSFYYPFPLVRMRLGGATNKSFRNIFTQNIECLRAFRKNKMRVNFLYPFYRLIPKIKQYSK